MKTITKQFVQNMYVDTFSPENRPLLRKRCKVWARWKRNNKLEVENYPDGKSSRYFPDNLKWKLYDIHLGINKFLTIQGMETTVLNKVRKYVKMLNTVDRDEYEPILLLQIGDFEYSVEDGHHRFFAALEAGEEYIEAYVVDIRGE